MLTAKQVFVALGNLGNMYRLIVCYNVSIILALTNRMAY